MWVPPSGRHPRLGSCSGETPGGRLAGDVDWGMWPGGRPAPDPLEARFHPHRWYQGSGRQCQPQPGIRPAALSCSACAHPHAPASHGKPEPHHSTPNTAPRAQPWSTEVHRFFLLEPVPSLRHRADVPFQPDSDHGSSSYKHERN